MRTCICLLAAIALLGTGLAQARPLRVVSLDYCSDQYVLGLAERGQIAAVSMEARNDYSSHAALAEGLLQVRPRASDVLGQRPDLVVRSWGGDPRLLAMLERMGIGVHQIGPVSSFDDIRRETLRAGEALGASQQGQSAVARMDAALARAPRHQSRSALYVTPGGVTGGQGTFVHALIEAAGLGNRAGEASGWISLPLEAVATQTPDLLVTGFINSDTDRVDRWSVSRHPVMRRALDTRPVFALETGIVACPTWLAGEEAVRLGAFARRHLPVAVSGAQP